MTDSPTIDLGPADFEAFSRSGMGSLTEFLKLPEAVRAEIIAANERVEDERLRVLALYVAGALSGAAGDLASTVDSGASEEAGNVAALNRALGGASV